ncbi:MAG: ketosynthase, partial [Pseudomonadota bacterium]
MTVALLRLPLALAYPVLAHVAAARDDDALAAVALADLLLVLLVGPLLRRRPWAIALTLAAVPALVALARSPH